MLGLIRITVAACSSITAYAEGKMALKYLIHPNQTPEDLTAIRQLHVEHHNGNSGQLDMALSMLSYQNKQFGFSLLKAGLYAGNAYSLATGNIYLPLVNTGLGVIATGKVLQYAYQNYCTNSTTQEEDREPARKANKASLLSTKAP